MRLSKESANTATSADEAPTACETPAQDDDDNDITLVETPAREEHAQACVDLTEDFGPSSDGSRRPGGSAQVNMADIDPDNDTTDSDSDSDTTDTDSSDDSDADALDEHGQRSEAMVRAIAKAKAKAKRKAKMKYKLKQRVKKELKAQQKAKAERKAARKAAREGKAKAGGGALQGVSGGAAPMPSN